jgi:hypothetical protein
MRVLMLKRGLALEGNPKKEGDATTIPQDFG